MKNKTKKNKRRGDELPKRGCWGRGGGGKNDPSVSRQISWDGMAGRMARFLPCIYPSGKGAAKGRFDVCCAPPYIHGVHTPYLCMYVLGSTS